MLAKGDGGPGNELPEPPRLCSFACPPVVFTFIDPRGGLEESCIAISFRKLVREPERRAESEFVGEMLYASKLWWERKARVVMVRVDFVEGAVVEVEVAVLLRPGGKKDKDAMCTSRVDSR